MTIGGADDRLATDEVDCVAPVEVTGAELIGIVFMMALFGVKTDVQRQDVNSGETRQ